MSETYDFGAGPVPAHQHPNGGGWVAAAAFVAPKAWIGPAARVAGGTIWGGTIWGGTIGGGTIRGDREVMVVGPVGSENQTVTLVRDGDSHLLGIGCWHGYKVGDMAAEVQCRVGDRPDLMAEYAAVETLLRVRLAEWGQR